MEYKMKKLIFVVLAMISVFSHAVVIQGETAPAVYTNVKVDTVGRQTMLPVPVQVLQTDNGDSRVTGTIANLAASAVVTIYFDLGVDWMYYNSIGVTLLPTTPSTGISNVQLFGTDVNGSFITARRLGSLAATSASATIFIGSMTSASGSQTIYTKPIGRYVVLSVTNADATNALGSSSKVYLTAYTN